MKNKCQDHFGIANGIAASTWKKKVQALYFFCIFLIGTMVRKTSWPGRKNIKVSQRKLHKSKEQFPRDKEVMLLRKGFSSREQNYILEPLQHVSETTSLSSYTIFHTPLPKPPTTVWEVVISLRRGVRPIKCTLGSPNDTLIGNRILAKPTTN